MNQHTAAHEERRATEAGAWYVSIDGETVPFPSLQDACEFAASKVDGLRGGDEMWHGSATPKTSALIHRALKAARAADATGDFVDCLASAIERSAKPKNRGARLLIAGARIDVQVGGS